MAGTLIVLALGGSLGTASVAQAEPISIEYCDFSLRGGGTLAPDNDIKTFWDDLESSLGIDIVASKAMDSYRSGDDIAIRYDFIKSDGVVAGSPTFQCYRINGVYHDSRLG